MFIYFPPELGEPLYYHYFELFIGGVPISFSLEPFSEVSLILSFGIHSSVSFGLTLCLCIISINYLSQN